MGRTNVKIRAAIFDIYNTLLAVGAPPADAAVRWNTLWQTQLGAPARVSLEQFAETAEQIIAREHAAAHARGVIHPEIAWPDIVREVLPELNPLPADRLADFVFQQMQIRHTVGLMPGATDVLRAFSKRGVLLGVASNAQAYTLREIEGALAPDGLSRQIFRPDLCFFSFEHGFSKPNPQVFRLLTDRLRAHDISPQTTLMVGNHLRKDIEPAKAQDWQTWHLTAQSPAQDSHEGDWEQFARWLEAELP